MVAGKCGVECQRCGSLDRLVGAGVCVLVDYGAVVYRGGTCIEEEFAIWTYLVEFDISYG